jgi:catalase (peroxidase I)
MFSETWTPSQSASGNDQWAIRDSRSAYANTYRLTADLALINDDIYRPIAEEYAKNPDKFDSDFADAWYAMVHRSANHPKTDDLEKDVGFCTTFDFVPDVNAKGPLNIVV